MKNIFASLVISSAALIHSIVQAEELPAYTMPMSEVIAVHAEANNKDYELYIQLPKSYKETNTNYPLIVVNDVRFAFPSTIGALQLMGGHDTQEAIIVGISYSKGDDIRVSRTRDYTPTHSPNEKNGHSIEARKASGYAKEYMNFIADQVIPLMQKNYRVDANNKVFVGHSFGGLLGTYILLHKPEIFNHYIIGSPSLWYDKGVMFKMESEYAKNQKSLSANVMMYVGALETAVNPMVDDLLKFEKQLRSRNYQHLKLHVEVLKDENHHTVFPSLVSKGLIKAIPKK